jgi:hypothetical protein
MTLWPNFEPWPHLSLGFERVEFLRAKDISPMPSPKLEGQGTSLFPETPPSPKPLRHGWLFLPIKYAFDKVENHRSEKRLYSDGLKYYYFVRKQLLMKNEMNPSNVYMFSGALVKLRKVTIILVVSVRPHETTREGF